LKLIVRDITIPLFKKSVLCFRNEFQALHQKKTFPVDDGKALKTNTIMLFCMDSMDATLANLTGLT
jgi:hypothetical protein